MPTLTLTPSTPGTLTWGGTVVPPPATTWTLSPGAAVYPGSAVYPSMTITTGSGGGGGDNWFLTLSPSSPGTLTLT